MGDCCEMFGEMVGNLLKVFSGIRNVVGKGLGICY